MVAYIDSRAQAPPVPCPYPKVEWSKLNPNNRKHLPIPDLMPIQGCPVDPEIYPDAPSPTARIMVVNPIQDEIYQLQ